MRNLDLMRQRASKSKLPDNNYIFIKHEDTRSRFPVPDWLDRFLKSQPTSSHSQTLNAPNAKFIVLMCYSYDMGRQLEACGGITDRLMFLPYQMWLAHKTGRRLLISYHKPYPLEAFLVPPQDGFDWRLPKGYLREELAAYANRTSDQYKAARWINWKYETMASNPYKNQ